MEMSQWSPHHIILVILAIATLIGQFFFLRYQIRDMGKKIDKQEERIRTIEQNYITHLSSNHLSPLNALFVSQQIGKQAADNE